ncbi:MULTISPECIES: YafY family protein [Actinomadura]|uniref:WYL domain-containing protein n=1 Tax=Actinomadura litoris TaxID=2678616 RepID=A0A7K1KUZ5_9ACTN|nr:MULTISPECIES: YafY family protein [Actinomadura]MBT2211058.1 YafY family transcriptional regulator [Actinomadura sp. NEAU-AAG7]MUN35979.1 WYL domain-containing protein [Actinomadura litoris]
MNRTDRLYALVEELRARAPRRVSARELAARYEVSVRTIERDIGALQQAGVPIFADVGRGGGYTLDKSRTLPPLNFTPAEAVAIAIALARADGSPYSRAARTALHKIVTAMSDGDGASARELAERIRFLTPPDVDAPASVPAVLEEAVSARRVVRLGYVDGGGTESERDVEPVAFTGAARRWYFLGWCRLRGDFRAFRIDRVRRAALLDEPAPERRFEDLRSGPPDYVVRRLEFV